MISDGISLKARYLTLSNKSIHMRSGDQTDTASYNKDLMTMTIFDNLKILTPDTFPKLYLIT